MFLGSPPAPCADPGPHGLQSVCSGLQSAAQRVFNVLELVESIVNSACYDPTDVHITDLRHCRRCWGKLRRVNTTFRDVVTPLLFRFVRASHHTATTRHAHFLPLLLLPEHAPVMEPLGARQSALTRRGTRSGRTCFERCPTSQPSSSTCNAAPLIFQSQEIRFYRSSRTSII